MENFKKSRTYSFIIIAFIYILAFIVGWITFVYTPGYGDIIRLFFADFAATVVIWLFGVYFKNSSVYDPYWSVAPIAIITPLVFYYEAFDVPTLLMLIAVWVWGVRLTLNWAYTFEDLTIQDWRYEKLKNETGKLWHFINFTGINLMPTVIVFLAMIPAFKLMTFHQDANLWTYAGFALSLFAAGLQYFSDKQAHRFRKENPGKVCTKGLWKYSRHPNYLGEILMWWGVYLILLSVAPQEWLTLVGALANTFLFVFISIPLMEKRQLENKQEYVVYKEKTGRLFPGF